MNKQNAIRNQAAAGAEKKNVYQVITDRIVELLQKGTIPWKKSWTTVRPQNLVTGHIYHGFNRLLLSASEFISPYFLTAKQCHALGGRIRKGERGTPVVYYQNSWKLADGSYSDGKNLTAEQKQSLSRSAMLKYYTVFNVTQCIGLDDHLPEPPADAGVQESFPFDVADTILENFQNGPIVQQAETFDPCYYPRLDVVQMPNLTLFKSPAHYYQTLFHELVHATGHASRLARPEVTTRETRFGSEEYSREELVAEIGSSFLMNQAGILNDEIVENNVAYIQHWIAKLQNDPKLIVYAASTAEKACNFILTGASAAQAA
jgi:antirestriction protein ArdC